MSYDAMRHFADSYGLIFMMLCWASAILWIFRPSAKAIHDRASVMIFDEDMQDSGRNDAVTGKGGE